MQTNWEYRYAQRTLQMKSSTIRELLKLTENPEIISFAGGMPAPEIFPAEELKKLLFASCATRLRKLYNMVPPRATALCASNWPKIWNARESGSRLII